MACSNCERARQELMRAAVQASQLNAVRTLQHLGSAHQAVRQAVLDKARYAKQQAERQGVRR